MKIRKFEAQTEQDAIEKVRDELGMDALVLNIKKIEPKGLFAFFRKTVVEVTAAYEERTDQKQILPNDAKQASILENNNKKSANNNEIVENEKTVDIEIGESSKKDESESKIKDLEIQIESTEQLLSKLSRQLLATAQKMKDGERKYNAEIVQMFYDTLVSNGVISSIAEKILDEVDLIEDIDKIDINLIVKIVYNTIINMLNEPATVNPVRIDKKLSKPEIYTFIGSTGVGKTTTIAKLAADFILKQNLSVGLITADTYRIAAVEQLKLYADILGVEVCVVYELADLTDDIDKLSGINDVIMIDTAGRSHKSEAPMAELVELLKVVEGCKIFLVISLSTKYEDMLDIVKTYEKIANFSIVFTKWDETTSVGTILNICHITGRQVAYITTGQNVPDDFRPMRPEWVARTLLGLGEE